MIRKIVIPTLSTNVEEASITEWLKKEGDPVLKGEPIAELTTDKAAFEFESPCSGVLRKILARKKSTIPVGYVMALIGGPADPLPDVTEANRKLLDQHRQAAGRKKPGSGQSALAASGKAMVRATPAARRLARERRLDLAAVQRSAKADVVTEEMVRDYRP